MIPVTPVDPCRPPVTRAKVLAAALRIADEEGVENLSMRKLGRACGIEAMSLYHHVPDKAAILDGLGDAVFADVDYPPASEEAPWQDALAGLGQALYAALLRHPGALPIIATRPSFFPAGLRLIEALLEQLQRAGLDSWEASHAGKAIGVYVVGFAQATVGRSPLEPYDHSPQAWQRRGDAVDPDEFPALSAALRDDRQWDMHHVFTLGLRAMINGFAPGPAQTG